MSIKLQSLYQSMQSVYKWKIVAAKSGLSNIVSWIHFIEDPTTISEFLRPGELVITTGVAYKGACWLYDLIRDLHQFGASGLVVNTGGYITGIQEEIIEYCEKIGFPVFTFPWEIHLVDVIQSCSTQILDANKADDSVATALQNLIFTPSSAPLYLPLLKKYNYEADAEYQVVLMGTEEPSKMNAEMELTIRTIASRFLPCCSVFFQEDVLIMVLQHPEEAACRQTVEQIASFLRTSSGIFLNIGVGAVVTGTGLLPVSYKKALAAFHYSGNNRISPAFYNSLGLDRLFYSLEDFTAISEIYKSQLGVLEEYDQKHGTDYIDTLRLYLQYSESVQKVADKTFTHRNTVNYRISKIKSLLGCDFQTMDDRFPYEVAFYCRDMIQKAGRGTGSAEK